MRGREIITALDHRRNENHCFVKWWRKEADFLDFDLGSVQKRAIGTYEIADFMITLNSKKK